MSKSMKVLAIIPARGGSRRVPRKNIKPLAGKPLIAWTIQEALLSKSIDRLVVSTDDPEIARVAQAYGCEAPFLRPTELAQDDTPGILPILHAMENIGPEYTHVLMLQPTSPLRIAEDIDTCLTVAIQAQAPVVTISEPLTTPFHCYTQETNGTLNKLVDLELRRTQDYPPVYALNGAVYVASYDWLKREQTFLTHETVGSIMPQERSFDIDTDLEFALCEYLLMRRAGQSG